MGTANSTRRLSSKKPGVPSGGNGLRHQVARPEKDEALPSYRKPELQDFECVICKDLVFKPVVNACGHGFFCFWCAHESMGAGFQSSTCPMCRSTFSHMPRVCELAHSYLTKTWPVEYGARAAEVEAEERQRNMFSPEPIGLPQHVPQHLESTPQQLDVACSSSCWGKMNCCEGKEKGTVSDGEKQAVGEILEGGEDLNDCQLAVCAGTGAQQRGAEQLSARDCECLLCNKLLFQPVVLSCGHAYCFLCLEERFPETPVTCAYCQKAHLEDEVAVCGQLQEVIQGAFPVETHRRIVQERARMGNRKGLLKRVSAPDEQLAAPKGFVHFGIECDACGVYPIVGDRYQCQDCEEEIGFDLCGRCHAGREQPMVGSYLFKQKHLPQHTMHRVEPIPTFLHQVMENNPELSVSTVISMVMSMAEELGNETRAPVSSPPEDEVLNLAETNLFDEPQAAAPRGVLSQEDLTPAAGVDGITAAELFNAADGDAFEDIPQADDPGPLDLTPRLVRTVLALAEEEQAAARGAQPVGLASGSTLQGPGPVVETSQAQPTESESDGDRPVAMPGAREGDRTGVASARSGLLDGASEQADVWARLPQRENGRRRERRNAQVWSSSEAEGLGFEDTWQQGDAAQGAIHVAADREDSSGYVVVSHAQGGSAGGPGFEDASRGGTDVEHRGQAGGGARVEMGRGRASTEDRRATQERQQRASCEPGLRRTDSYHQLMMASA